MAEISPVPNENLDSGQHLVTRRRLIKQAGAAGIALTALYVAPSFSSFGPKKAYAAITGVPPCDSELCDGRKAAKLTMQYTGLANAGSNSQDSGKVNVSGD
ncbi:MAG: twin-arginine translocation signal domain-containing protein, partial [Chloroflexi bacterium]|nr:twin-arginine translocation signal domain-containing protein [Chloroflexota bacterium]